MVSAKVCLVLLLCAVIATDNASGCVLDDEVWDGVKQHVETNMATMGVMTSAVDYLCDGYDKNSANARHDVFKRAVHKSKGQKRAGARNGEPKNMTSLQDKEQEWLFFREVLTGLLVCLTLDDLIHLHCHKEISSIRERYPRMTDEQWKDMKHYMNINMETVGVMTAMLSYISKLTDACENKEDGHRHAVFKRAVHESKGHKRNGEPGKKRSIQDEESEWEFIRLTAETFLDCGQDPMMHLYCTGEPDKDVYT